MLPGLCVVTKKSCGGIIWESFSLVNAEKCWKLCMSISYVRLLLNVMEHVRGDRRRCQTSQENKENSDMLDVSFGCRGAFQTLHPCSSIMLHCSSVQARWWKLLSHNKNRPKSSSLIHPFFEQDDFVTLTYSSIAAHYADWCCQFP